MRGLWTHESKLIVCPGNWPIGRGPDAVESEKAGAYLALTRTRPNPFREHLPESVLLAARGTAS